MYPEYVLEKFLKDIDTCRSIDCYLTKLSSAVFALEDYLQGNPFVEMTNEGLVRDFLYNEDVQRVLANLADYWNVVARRIQSDVRFKNLRRYEDLILEAITAASCRFPVSVSLSTDVRNALWRIEYEEKYSSKDYEFYEAVEYVEPVTSRRVELSEMARKESGARSKHYELLGNTGSEKRRNSKKVVAVIAIMALILVFTLAPNLNRFMGIRIFPYSTKHLQNQTTSKDLSSHMFFLDLGETVISISSSGLVVEHQGRWLPYLWLEVGDSIIYLTSYNVDEPSVVADYVFVNSTYSKAIFSLDKVVQLITEHYREGLNIELNIDVESKVCYIELLDNESFAFTSCKSALFFPSLTLSDSSMYDVVLYDINANDVDYLREHLISKLKASSTIELVWKLLEWIDKNTEYDYWKAMIPYASTSDPIEFFSKRSGVCVDYAVFTATALLASGFNETYILTFDTGEGGHAVAGVKINGVLYVLDQKLPVYEWSDYVEYVYEPVGEAMQILKVSLDELGNTVLEIRTVDSEHVLKSYPDTYPSDIVPKSLVQDAINILSRKLGFTYTSRCPYKYYYRWRLLDWKVLKAYTPIFHEQFTMLLVDTIEKELYNNLLTANCVWCVIEGNTLYIYIG